MSSPFDHCAQDYAAARPPYPEVMLDAILEYLRDSLDSLLDPRCLLAADLGAGTSRLERVGLSAV